MTREKYDRIVSKVAHIRKLREEQKQLLDKLVKQAAYELLWPGFSRLENRSAGLKKVPVTAFVPSSELGTENWMAEHALRGRRLLFEMRGGKETREFTLDELPAELGSSLLDAEEEAAGKGGPSLMSGVALKKLRREKGW